MTDGEDVSICTWSDGFEDTYTLECAFYGVLNNDGTYASGSMSYKESCWDPRERNNLNWYASR